MNVDIDFWRTPSRRFYVTKFSDYNEIQKTIKRKKLSLKRKGPIGTQYVDLTESDGASTSQQFDRIEELVKKVRSGSSSCSVMFHSC